jgi:hypothetical protein
LCYSQRGDDPHENLAIFGDKLNMKVNCVKHPSIIFGYLLEPCIEIKIYTLIFHRILAIENLKEHMILTLFKIFNKSFWPYIYIYKAQGVFFFFFFNFCDVAQVAIIHKMI